ncbi:MAG: endonuclease domain-containing protein [Cyanobacteria bacterium J06592_8]
MSKDSLRIRGTNPRTEQAARFLRKNLTPAEAKLWSALRSRQLAGLKFRRQHPVGQFIVDFYCPSCKLIIEVDGDIHIQQQAYDEARTNHIQSFGYRVLRFTNEEVLCDLQTVLDHILEIAKADFPPANPIIGSREHSKFPPELGG